MTSDSSSSDEEPVGGQALMAHLVKARHMRASASCNLSSMQRGSNGRNRPVAQGKKVGQSRKQRGRIGSVILPVSQIFVPKVPKVQSAGNLRKRAWQKRKQLALQQEQVLLRHQPRLKAKPKWNAKPNANTPEYIENSLNFSFWPLSRARIRETKANMISATNDED